MLLERPIVRELRTKDTVPFQCRRCGTCCRHLRGQLMVESMDAYRLANYLRAHGRPDIEMIDIMNDYTELDILPGNYPVFLMKEQGPDDTCVFLKEGACSVYPVRPRACRLYPFAVNVGERGRNFLWYQSLDRPFHFTGGTVSVKDWFYQNFSKDDRSFVMHECQTIPEIGMLLRGLDERALDAAHRDIILLRYGFFDLDQPFLPQYERNTAELMRRLRRLCGSADSDHAATPDEKV